MVRLVSIIVILGLTLREGLTLQCWTCSSDIDRNCGDPFSFSDGRYGYGSTSGYNQPYDQQYNNPRNYDNRDRIYQDNRNPETYRDYNKDPYNRDQTYRGSNNRDDFRQNSNDHNRQYPNDNRQNPNDNNRQYPNDNRQYPNENRQYPNDNRPNPDSRHYPVDYNRTYELNGTDYRANDTDHRPLNRDDPNRPPYDPRYPDDRGRYDNRGGDYNNRDPNNRNNYNRPDSDRDGYRNPDQYYNSRDQAYLNNRDYSNRGDPNYRDGNRDPYFDNRDPNNRDYQQRDYNNRDYQGRGGLYDPNYPRRDLGPQRAQALTSSQSGPRMTVCNEEEARLRRMRYVCLKKVQRIGEHQVTYIRRCEMIPIDRDIGTCRDAVARGISLDFCEYCDHEGCNSASGLKLNILMASLVPFVILWTLLW